MASGTKRGCIIGKASAHHLTGHRQHLMSNIHMSLMLKGLQRRIVMTNNAMLKTTNIVSPRRVEDQTLLVSGFSWRGKSCKAAARKEGLHLMQTHGLHDSNIC